MKRLILLLLLLLALASGCAQNAQVGQAVRTETALTPEAPPLPTAEAGGEVIQGTGPLLTAAVSPPAARTVVDIRFDGTSAFSVRAVQGGARSTLVDTVGPYRGQRPLVSAEPVTFDVYAQGGWSLRLAPLLESDAMPFSGSGDGVSPAFAPPPPGQWDIRYNGASNFVVWLRCQDTSDLVANSIGPTRASARVVFGSGPCFWDVLSNGPWSLTPEAASEAITPAAISSTTSATISATVPAAASDASPASISVATEASISTSAATVVPSAVATTDPLPTESASPAAVSTELPTAEATASPALSSPTTAAGPTTPAPERVLVAHTEGEGVFLRASKRTSDRLSLYPEGTVLIVLGPSEPGEGRLWLPVQAPDGTHGWVAMEFVAPYNP